ncbi:hypothetical protein GGTG_07032 [Gaeumannomyces tritici R3-111a-1]|uniref:Uncharacterized protein n=1 Tax=Gaeumannomyces tritici (strain R3-111a-1) TaxID=644352 RepID=J3P0I7_GAET3|nr:hypothetical protein GGTG_07032 [Gaeumannomyces tritici R3-111a-1]EJT77120.1 hypothetical protein GGTG_07032 [Gaeumannomyces tritici R3-111a-1]
MPGSGEREATQAEMETRRDSVSDLCDLAQALQVATGETEEDPRQMSRSGECDPNETRHHSEGGGQRHSQ